MRWSSRQTTVVALCFAVPASAQEAAPAKAAQAQQLERVEITGTRPDETQERRLSTTAKIIVGRDEIERYGDSSVGDLLKRLPGVTIQGRPGRGGNIRMRGLGNGYTQILLDGERVPSGFSIDSLNPEQIERIEILRAPTAETGARAIAGTINIITREGFRRALNDLRITTGYENESLQPAFSWTRSDSSGPLDYNLSLSAQQNERRSDTTGVTEAHDVATGTPTRAQTDTGLVRERRQNLHATGRLQWRSPSFGTLTLMPILIHGSGTTVRDGQLVRSLGEPASYETAHSDSDGSFTLTRLNANWTMPLAGAGRFEWHSGLGQARSLSHSVRVETGGAAPRALTEEIADVRDGSLSLSGKLNLAMAELHTVVTGIEAELNRRNETRTGDPALDAFEPNLKAHATRLAAYAQDEWNLTPTWALHAGLRWEGITTRGSGADIAVLPTNRSSVWAPLLHALWKPDPKSRDQVRVSLTRSYRSPPLGNLIARPAINKLPNSQTQPDRAGNPALRPELATGIDVGVERHPVSGGILSANLFHRRITDYMRNVTKPEPETVPWANEPRYVSRPQNIGNATTQGLELEAKFRLSGLLPDAPAIDLRANAGVYRSRVASVTAPDNRIDQQPGATANLGADWRPRGTPLTVGADLNWTPAYTTRVADTQTAFQGRKRIIEARALWVFDPAAQLRLSASNLDPRDYVTASSLDAAGIRETTTTIAPTSLYLQVRLEMKL